MADLEIILALLGIYVLDQNPTDNRGGASCPIWLNFILIVASLHPMFASFLPAMLCWGLISDLTICLGLAKTINLQQLPLK